MRVTTSWYVCICMAVMLYIVCVSGLDIYFCRFLQGNTIVTTHHTDYNMYCKRIFNHTCVVFTCIKACIIRLARRCCEHLSSYQVVLYFDGYIGIIITLPVAVHYKLTSTYHILGNFRGPNLRGCLFCK